MQEETPPGPSDSATAHPRPQHAPASVAVPWRGTIPPLGSTRFAPRLATTRHTYAESSPSPASRARLPLASSPPLCGAVTASEPDQPLCSLSLSFSLDASSGPGGGDSNGSPPGVAEDPTRQRDRPSTHRGAHAGRCLLSLPPPPHHFFFPSLRSQTRAPGKPLVAT